MNKVNKWLGIINLFLWTGLFISLFFMDYNANCLKDFAIAAVFVVLVDISFDLLGSRKTKIKREAKIELIYEIEDEFNKRIKEKQGKK